MAASGGVVVGAEGEGSIVMSMARLVVVVDVKGVNGRLRGTRAGVLGCWSNLGLFVGVDAGAEVARPKLASGLVV